MKTNGLDLQRIYRRRFQFTREYRNQVWKVLTSKYFTRHIGERDTVLDLGCGYGEFINNVRCGRKFAIDLNIDAQDDLDPAVRFLQQDCSEHWELPDGSLDVVFSSNFFEHLPDKQALSRTLAEAGRCLRSGGKLIAMGPNIRFVPGKYWDFWDHHIPLSHLSLAEALQLHGFEVVKMLQRFLPFTLANAPRYPLFLLRVYLRLPIAFRVFGQQFLVVARRM